MQPIICGRVRTDPIESLLANRFAPNRLTLARAHLLDDFRAGTQALVAGPQPDRRHSGGQAISRAWLGGVPANTVPPAITPPGAADQTVVRTFDMGTWTDDPLTYNWILFFSPDNGVTPWAIAGPGTMIGIFQPATPVPFTPSALDGVGFYYVTTSANNRNGTPALPTDSNVIEATTGAAAVATPGPLVFATPPSSLYGQWRSRRAAVLLRAHLADDLRSGVQPTVYAPPLDRKWSNRVAGAVFGRAHLADTFVKGTQPYVVAAPIERKRVRDFINRIFIGREKPPPSAAPHATAVKLVWGSADVEHEWGSATATVEFGSADIETTWAVGPDREA